MVSWYTARLRPLGRGEGSRADIHLQAGTLQKGIPLCQGSGVLSDCKERLEPIIASYRGGR